MSTISQRPGVYSSYTVSSLYAPSRNARGAAVIAASGTAGSQGVEITTLAQLEGAFSQEDGALYTAVRLLLASGVPKVFCIGLGQNPDAQQYTAALELLKSRKDCYGILCDSALAAVHTAFAGYLEEGAQSQREQLAFFGIGEGEDALTAAQGANQERMIFTAGSAGAFGLEKSPLVPAAAVAVNQVLVNESGIKITYTGMEMTEEGNAELRMTVENNSEQPILVNVQDFSANGMMMNAMFATQVTPGKKSNDELTIYASTLEENGVTAVESVEFSLVVFNDDTLDTIVETDLIALTV